MERDITTIFKGMVNTKTPIQVHFEIDGTFIPVNFVLHRSSLKLDPTQGKDACIKLTFEKDYVDIFDYYWRTHRTNCPNLSHEDFFKISNIVAALYGTKLMVSLDASYKVIKGFRVESEVLSMTKKNGRTFYGKYDLISSLDPAYEAAAAELKPEADNIIHRITYFEGDEAAREELNKDLKLFYTKVKATIEKYTDSTMDDTIDDKKTSAQKNPTPFKFLDIVADGIPVEVGTTPSSIIIIASTHSGGSNRKRTKRRRKPRTRVRFVPFHR